MSKFLRLNWNQTEKIIEKLSEKISEYKPDILIGVSRGGLVPVRIFSDMLGNRNVAIIKVEFYEKISKTKATPEITQGLQIKISGKKVLVIDDVSDSGKSLFEIKKYLEERKPKELRFATLHFKPNSIFKPDYFIGVTDKWIIYPWEKQEVKRELRKENKKVKK